MYAMVTRRRPAPGRQEEVRRRADTELWPKLRQAPGFVAAYVVAGADGLTTGISLFEDRAHAEAFRPTAQAWGAAMDELGGSLESGTEGEVVAAITPER